MRQPDDRDDEPPSLALAQDLILDLFTQACGKWHEKEQLYTFDHMCLSTYENAQDYLLQAGLIKALDCERR